MIQHVESHLRRSPGPGGRPGFSLVELVIVLWVVGVLMAVAAPTFGGARDRARSRLTAGVVSQEIRRAGQLAFARGEAYTLDAGVSMNSLILTPFGGVAETVIDLADLRFDSKVIANTILPYTAKLEFDSKGEVISPISWDFVTGSTSSTVVQEMGTTEPVITKVTNVSAAQKAVINLWAQL